MTTATKTEWVRVSKKAPCPVCSRPDWCTRTADGTAACCMRLESPTRMKNGGWLHRLEDPLPVYQPIPKPKPATTINAATLMRYWDGETTPEMVSKHAAELGVSVYALNCLGAAWASPHRAWAFPMKDGDGKIIGIRLRNRAGDKWAVPGSHNGLFIPDHEGGETVYVCEGPTDTAAAVTLGMCAIGRPNCNACEDMLLAAIKRTGARRVVIIPDADEPGLRGADKLQERLRVPSCQWLPPCKDLREYVANAGTFTMILAAVKDTKWTVPR